MPTLYINGKEIEAHLDNRRIRLERVEDALAENAYVPVFDIERVVIIGYPKVSINLLCHFTFNNIPVIFLTYYGRWLSSMLPLTNGSAFRRIRQYEAAKDKSLALKISSALIFAKIKNMRRVLQRLAAYRNLTEDPEYQNACESLALSLRQLKNATDLDMIRGYEGAASAHYFSQLATYFPENMPFTSRNRRPPKDPANALLSWTYSILSAEIDTAIKTSGLDSTIGFLHGIEYGRPSLALDLIEPLRAPLCDLLALNILNHQRLTPADFEHNPQDGGVYLSSTARKTFFVEYEQYMERLFKEDKTSAHVTFRRVIQNMVNNICQVLEGKAEPHFYTMP